MKGLWLSPKGDWVFFNLLDSGWLERGLIVANSCDRQHERCMKRGADAKDNICSRFYALFESSSLC